jgi:hypothetical protein
MEYHRKQAKALFRAFRADDPEAVGRAETVLGAGAHEGFPLSDAQHVVAREQGFRTWRELKAAQAADPEWVDGEDVVARTDRQYRPGEPVEVVVRKRGRRFDVSDGGRAVELAGWPDGWRSVAERLVEDVYWINVNRRGLVFVQATERRLDELVHRVAECSAALYVELLDLEQPA